MVSIIQLIVFASLLPLTHCQTRDGVWKGTSTNYDYTPYLYARYWDVEITFITKVCVKTDENIRHLKLEFSDGSLGDFGDDVPTGGEIGGGLESYSWQCFQVEPNECFVTINLKIGQLMDAMQVLTSKGRQSDFWGDESGGDPETISAYDGECISECKFRIDTSTNPNRFRQIKCYFNDITWSPTRSPTSNPTSPPTPKTTSPSKTPSETPTLNPTIQPATVTEMHSSSPTDLPSRSPSDVPTVSSVQTITPSNVPSVSPTVVPTAAPDAATPSPSIGTYSTITATDRVTHVMSLTRDENEGSIAGAPMGNLMNMVYIVVGIFCVCIFIVACAWVCHKRSKKNKPAFVIDNSPKHSQMTFVRNTSTDPQQHKALSPADLIEDEEERKKIKEWIDEVVKLPEYYEILIENGFDKMEFIMDISTKEELKDIGITLMGHQTRILAAIDKYKAAPGSVRKEDRETGELEGQIKDQKTETKARFIMEEHSSESTSVIGGGRTTERTDGNNAFEDDNGDQDVDNIKVSDVLNVELFDDKGTKC